MGDDKSPLTTDMTERELESYGDALAQAIGIVEDQGIVYVAGGSLVSDTFGRPQAPGDIDIIVRPPDARRLLKAFEDAGFSTEESEPQWLYKAKKGKGPTVDIIFEMEKSLYLDEEMDAHARITEVHGVRLRVMSPEDYVVSQALSTKEDTSAYWYNALGVLTKSEIDWDYLAARASRGPRRVLALLIYGESNDLPIPREVVIRRLFESVYG